MIETLSLVDLDSNKDNKLILHGDYVNRGEDSYKVLYHIEKLEEKYPEQVVVLIGNHDQMFIDWYKGEDLLQWLEQDQELMTTRSFSQMNNGIALLRKI
ncbi:metallophosphoesterase [Bacillus cereus]|uniref:metallophosphoesterase n=1 Tax=Bacillus cereus TaxID=1396 RepID=UPI0032E03637